MTEQHSSSPATSTSGTMVEQEQPNQRNDDNSNPQQSASSTRNNNNECRPTSIEPEQELNAVNNVSASARNHPHECNKTASVGSITNPPAHPRQSLKIPPSQKDDRKLFVGGLPADITDEEFKVFFEQYGHVIDSIVMIDYETNRSRGFGFVTFSDPNVARYLLSRGHDDDDGYIPPELQEQARASMSGRVQMRDKWIEIKAAEPKAGGGGTVGGRGRYGLGTPSHGGGATVGRNRNAVNVAPFAMRNHRNTPPFIPPQPAGQAILAVGDPYNALEYGAAPATSYQHGTTTNQPPPQYPQYYVQPPPYAAGVYAHPYYYPPHIMQTGVHTYSHHHPAGYGDPAAAVDPSCTVAAVPMMQEDMDHGAEDSITHPETVYPVGFGYAHYMLPIHSSRGVTIVPVPPPHPSPTPMFHQQSVMQYVAPGIPVQSSSKDAENDSTDA